MDMNMTAREDLGLVWMGDMFLPNDPGEFGSLEPHPMETPYNSLPMDNSGCLDDISNRGQQMVSDPYLTNPNLMSEGCIKSDVESFMMLDEFDDPYMRDGTASAKYVSTASTQTTAYLTSFNRKIKPIKHPALKLQTPIAFQRDTDLSVIPIQKDGMGVCEKCGAIGVKHAFYTKERRYCSMKCARGPTDSVSGEMSAEQDDAEMGPMSATDNKSNALFATQLQRSAANLEMDMNKLAKLLPPPPPLQPMEERPFPPDKKTMPDLINTYEWTPQLSQPDFIAAPVSCFKHAPMADCWDNITVGMKVEVENTDCDNFSEDFPDSFWVATVLRIAGYKALLRYEGFGQNAAKDFWVNLCSSMVHPVGWCATRGKPLIPPKTIEDKYKDWKDFLVKRLTGARTLPSNFYNKVHDNLKSRFRCDLNLEVVDKNKISQVKVARIEKIVGKRLHVCYYDANPDDNGFWCHEDSPLIHPVGWAKRVGHTLDAPREYREHCAKGLRDKDDATEDLFPPLPFSHLLPKQAPFREGMKLEAIDPLNLSAICVATVKKILNEGYLMIRIDSYDDESSNTADWFCYHMTSPCIFPVGFCQTKGLPLRPPKDYSADTFVWADYLAVTGAEPAPPHAFTVDLPDHNFTLGMRLEAADLMDPRLICVGTVSRVIGRLLRIHFDGWEDDYDQWMDCESPDIYPVGWCQLVAHKLEGPPQSPVKNGATGQKSSTQKGVRKRRRGGGAGGKGRGGAHAQSTRRSTNTQQQQQQSSVFDYVEDVKDDWIIHAASTTTDQFIVGQDLDGIGSVDEPEMAAEPVGPDQTLPVSSNADQSTQPTSPVNSQVPVEQHTMRLIPRLIDCSGPLDTKDLVPDEWTVTDVGQFLRVNDCTAYSESFTNQEIDGKALLLLTKEKIMSLTGKVGPSLKIFDLIQQLKNKVNPAEQRRKASLKKLN
ncbi:polycomb protein Sfmbt isoform X2 [Nilaparvata lugens]|uniref:polycomb protein Sfmbt isoform X2 n=1 Tax=Nilaparvata lugens TaxID=108931 RepID=UPI00193E9FAB|nr:polycomb protein Sfmbt isoform X2 [Nilaparvata lugens]